jgi:AraC-like DNA-binding protein
MKIEFPIGASMTDPSDEKGTRFCATQADALACRRSWFLEVVNVVQHLAGQPVCSNVDDGEMRLVSIARRLPPAETPLERFVLRSTLLESARRLSDRLHRQEHRDDRVPCTLEAQTILQRFFSLEGARPGEEFQEWAVSFYSELRRAHPRSKAQRVAYAIRSSHDRTLSVRTLAAGVGLTTSGLIRSFRNEFGCTPNEYQRGLRLIDALDRVPSDEIEAVATDVGYRSKKNFYRMFKNLTGLTPSAFRVLPAHEQSVVMLQARRRINVK